VKPVIVSSAAEIDAAEAFDWYESRSFGLGDRFLRSVRVTLTRIGDAPLAFQLVRRATRRAQVTGFPYSVYFRELGDVIVVVAIFHGKRGPVVRATRGI